MKQNHTLANYTKRLGREDGFITWNILMKILNNQPVDFEELPELIKKNSTNVILASPAAGGTRPGSDSGQARMTKNDLKLKIYNLWRALSPWPGLWTFVRVKDKELRLKLIQCHLEKEKFVIDQVQLEGKNPVSWKQFCEAYSSLF